MPKRESRKDRLQRFLNEQNLARIDRTAWRLIMDAFRPMSERAVRSAARQLNVEVEAPWGGVAQDDLQMLEHSLRSIGAAYGAANANADRELARRCRSAVIEAKDHARLVSRNPKVTEEKRALKREMVEWMLVWLGDPDMFPAWVDLRKKQMQDPQEVHSDRL